MATNVVKLDSSVLTLTAGATIAAGDLVFTGADIVGIALASATSGQEFACRVEGVVNVTKITGETWAEGDKIYAKPSTMACSKTFDATNYTTIVGVAVEAVGSSVLDGDIKLRGGSEADGNLIDQTLTGSSVANVAAGNVIGGVPVVHMVTLNAAAGNNAVVLTHKTRILTVTAIKTNETGTTSGTLTISNVANAITNAMTWDNTIAAKTVVPASTIDSTYWEVAAGAELRCVTNQAASRGTVVITGVRVA